MNKIAMKIKLTEGQMEMLKKSLSENEPTLTPKQHLFNAIDQSLDDEYNMQYDEFADVIAEYFNEYYGAHLKERFLNILNEKINS
jgi:hypothetical protein